MATALNVVEVIEELFDVENERSEEENENGVMERDDGERVRLDPNFDAIVYLKTKAIYPRQLLIGESSIWLATIRRRLTGRRRIRQPFTSKIQRDMPLEIFNVLPTVVEKLGFSGPSCYVECNSKAVVIAFSELAATTRFLSTLSAVTAKEIEENYFQRELLGRKKGSRAALLVSEDKQFSFTYFMRKRQMEILFYFGEWNSYGFPQHN